MCDILNEIIAIGGSTAHKTPFDAERMTQHYIAPRLNIACTVAEQEGELLGFQALQWADPDWEGNDPLPQDWAVIATFARSGRARQGIGSQLFAKARQAAIRADVTAIDATIRKENIGGLRYYSRMGFVDYRETDISVSKRFDLRAARET